MRVCATLGVPFLTMNCEAEIKELWISMIADIAPG